MGSLNREKKWYMTRLKSKLIESKAKDLSDLEINRVFKNTVLAKKNIFTAKELRDKGYLKL